MKMVAKACYLREATVSALPSLVKKEAPREDPVAAAAGTLLSRLESERPSPIRVDTLDEVSHEDSLDVIHIGPIEGKILQGSDDRLYALDFLRLTPRDANYVKVFSFLSYSREVTE